jgi:hypothetical protein
LYLFAQQQRLALRVARLEVLRLYQGSIKVLTLC